MLVPPLPLMDADVVVPGSAAFAISPAEPAKPVAARTSSLRIVTSVERATNTPMLDGASFVPGWATTSRSAITIGIVTFAMCIANPTSLGAMRAFAPL